jgi:hypothetical protein
MLEQYAPLEMETNRGEERIAYTTIGQFFAVFSHTYHSKKPNTTQKSRKGDRGRTL